MPIAQDSRKKPTDVKVRVSTGQGVEITWSDGHASRYDFPYLRERCPCALCNDEREKKARIGASPSGASAPSAVLPMFKPRVTAKSATAVLVKLVCASSAPRHKKRSPDTLGWRLAAACLLCIARRGRNPAPAYTLFLR